MPIPFEELRDHLARQHMTPHTAMESINRACGRYLSSMCLTRMIAGAQDIPDWLTLPMMDWSLLPERITESLRYNPIVRIDKREKEGEPTKLRVFRKNGDEQVIDDPLLVIELWTKHRVSAAIVNAPSHRYSEPTPSEERLAWQETRAWED